VPYPADERVISGGCFLSAPWDHLIFRVKGPHERLRVVLFRLKGPSVFSLGGPPWGVSPAGPWFTDQFGALSTSGRCCMRPLIPMPFTSRLLSGAYPCPCPVPLPGERSETAYGHGQGHAYDSEGRFAK
jgi:hypothetical protein